MAILLLNCCRSPVCLHDPWQDGLHDGWYCDQHGSWRDVWRDSWLGGWHCCLSLCLPAWWLTSLQGADSLSCHTYLWQWIVSFLYCVSKKNFLFFSLMRSSTSKNFRFLAQDRAWEYIREAKLSVLSHIVAHQVKTGGVEIFLMIFVFQDNEEQCLEKLSLSRQAIALERKYPKWQFRAI